MIALPSDAELSVLDRKIGRALASGDESELEVLGYGEISAVISLDSAHGRFACKRLPPFSSERRLLAYQECFDAYLAALAASDIKVLDSALARTGERTLYCIQPLVEPSTLAVNVFRNATPARQAVLFDQIAHSLSTSVGPRLGIDGQLSNWLVQDDGRLEYLDVTTPLLRDEEGEEQLDTNVFLAALPWILRGLVRRLLFSSIVATYYDRRTVLVDLLANLHKEGLTDCMSELLQIASGHVEEPITEKEVRRYYRSDARTWEMLLRVRRVDRKWQQKFRRRPYGFLLPGPIAR